MISHASSYYGGIKWSTDLNIVSNNLTNEYENMVFAYGNKQAGTYITFDTEKELQAFKLLRNKITNTFYTKTKVGDRYESLHFCFNSSYLIAFNENESCTFNTLANICNVSANLLRIRLAYELYFSHTVFDITKVDLTCKLPNEIIAEILWGNRSFLIVDIAKYIYQNPSIKLEYILQNFAEYDEKHVRYLINELERNNFIGIKDNNCYFIGRNPYKTRKRYCWGKLWEI